MTMTKSQELGGLHGCLAAAALKGVCYLTKYNLSGLKGIHQNLKKNSLKTMANTKVSQP